jgi:Holliday junction resolvase-like predicted endonuclease
VNDLRYVEKRIKIIVPDTWSNDQKGSFLEELVSDLLKRKRFHVVSRVRFTGMEIDILARDLDSQTKVLVECKCSGSSLSADVLTKLIGNAVVRKASQAYLFSTAPLGKEAKGLLEELEERDDQQVKLCFVSPEKFVEWFTDVKDWDLPDVRESGVEIQRISSITLLITPSIAAWAIEPI